MIQNVQGTKLLLLILKNGWVSDEVSYTYV